MGKMTGFITRSEAWCPFSRFICPASAPGGSLRRERVPMMHSTPRKCASAPRSHRRHTFAPSIGKQRLSVARHIVLPVRAAVERQFIARVEISSFIQRDDMMRQMLRWAGQAVAADGVANFGTAMKVEETTRNGLPWGFTVWIQRDGQNHTGVYMGFDEEVVSKFEYVGRDERGMPQPGGESSEVEGKHFEMWKVDDKPLDPETREVVRNLCEAAAESINKYYAFGSVFSEEL